MQVLNRDKTYEHLPPVKTPRPGHADLAGALDRGLTDARDVVERASARETAVRVAAGGLAAQFLRALGIRVLGHAVQIGGIDVGASPGEQLDASRARRDASALHALGDARAQADAAARIDEARREGDTLGGIVEVVVTGPPLGLGGHERPETKLTSTLAAAVMGIPAVRGVEVGLGFRGVHLKGSAWHDAILPAAGAGRPQRPTNSAGGIEGGRSNGEPIVLRAAMKPLSTLRTPLASVDLDTGEAAPARVERSDVTAVPRLVIVAEAVVALEVARHVRRRFGGASLAEVQEAVARHAERLARHPASGGA
jgi:chorismate synthase